jgi:iduronate 2-sulfatase
MSSGISRRDLLGAFAVGPLVRRAATRDRPNVLFIASDDLNNTLGCYGHPTVKSPNVDRLAGKGVRFERAYCQFPFCGPSRASLLTGLRPDTISVTTNENVDFRRTRPDTVTLPQLFKQNGWRSMRVGKIFHMGVPGGVGSMAHQDPPSWDISISPPGLEAKSPGERGNPNPDLRPGLRMTWVRTATADGQADSNAADKAVELLEEHGDEPFFLGLGFVRPHVPFVAPSRFFDLYSLDDIELVQNPPNDLDDIPAPAKNLRPYLWNHMGMTPTQQRIALRGYYASVSFLDEQVGRILGTLERLGLADRTIVVFFGDHGWHLGEHTHWQKMSLMEESVRAPLIIYAPGARGAGRSTRALVEFVDIYPTLADLCNLDTPELDGVSLVPVLDDPGRTVKRAAFSQVEYEGRIFGRSVRTGRYRFIQWTGDGGGEELYDHAADPREFTNLAEDAQHLGVLARMRRILAAGPNNG